MLRYVCPDCRYTYDDEAGIFHGEVINLRDVITFEGNSVEKLRHEFPEVDFVTEKELVKGEIKNADAIVAGAIPQNVLPDIKNLKIIFVPYAGVDALPLDFIRENHIRISNVHGNAPYVAERAIALTLSFFGNTKS